MKKLTKLNLAELAKTTNVIPRSEQDKYSGMYSDDCFWRCFAWMNGGDDSEYGAAYYAQAYWADRFANSSSNPLDEAHNFLNYHGGKMSPDDIYEFIAHLGTTGMFGYNPGYSPGGGMGIPGMGYGMYIAYVNVNDLSTDFYIKNGSDHAIVITGENPDGSLNFYDPQKSYGGTIPADEVQYVTRCMY